MSDYEEQFNEADYVAPLGVARVALNWVGAVASIALMVGLVYWVFHLGTRNPNDIPTIKALGIPARAQPENPGGQQANHQGLAVNAVQSEGGAAQPADTVVLAPKAQDLAPEDVSQNELAKVQPVLRPEQAEATQDVAAVTTPVLTEDVVQPTVQDPSLITEELVVESETKVISSSEFAPLVSTIPKPRPIGLKAIITQATPVAANTAVAAAADVAVGTRLVQLGAYDSQDIATSEWDKLMSKHSDLLVGKTRLIQSAESGGRKFYRLRAMGFETAEDSRNLCSALLARSTPCIPVTAR